MRDGFVAWPAPIMSSVLPSGVARATIADPICAFAPGRLSTTIDCPRRSPNLSLTMRANVSLVPPGASGTTSLIGRDGPCAGAMAAYVVENAAIAMPARALSQRIMKSSPDSLRERLWRGRGICALSAPTRDVHRARPRE
jgi:hypothetical protein